MTADLARWRGAAATLRAEAAGSAIVDRLTETAAAAQTRATARLGSLLLLSLDHRLQLRLQASVAAALAAEGRTAALTAATAARARPHLRALGWSGGLADVRLGEDASLTSDHAVLPPRWLASVWGRGLAGAVDGALVVDVTSVTPDGAAHVIAATPGKAGVAVRVDQWENA
jgi:hypothetical protein